MKKSILALMLLTLAACEDRPPAPSAEQNAALDEEAAHEKGPASKPADPNSN